MGSSGWTADPDYILIPSNATDDETRIFVGSDDPVALASGLDAGITFYGGDGGSAGFPAPTDQAFVVGVGPQPGGGTAKFQIVSQYIPTGALQNAFEVDVQFADAQQINIGATHGDLSINGNPAPGGIVAVGGLTAPSAAVAAETAICTLFQPGLAALTPTFRRNHVYSVEIDGMYSTPAGANLSVGFNVRKTNVAGLKLGEYGRYPAPANSVFYGCHGKRLFQVGAADITTTLCITMYPVPANQAQAQTIADTPFTAIVRDEGPALGYGLLGLITLV